MEPISKELTCPGCAAAVVVRVLPGGQAHVWHCPHCKKMQTSETAAVEAAPAKA